MKIEAQSMNVLYAVGETIGNSTKMKKGVLHTASLPYFISTDEGKLTLDHVISVEKSGIPGGGTVIKITDASMILFVLVPRIYIDKGNGFVVVNKSRTNKLYQLLNKLN